MNQPAKLIPRKERLKLRKRKSRAYSLLIEEGLIIIIPFLLFPVSETVAAFLLFSFTVILPFVTKQKIVMLFSNATLLAVLLIILYSISFVKMNSDLNILLVLLLIFAVLIVFLFQVLVIVIKVSSTETEKPPNIEKAQWYVKCTVKLIYYLNLMVDKGSLLLPLIYYAFVTILIINIYAVLYNGLNHFYEISDTQTGYYMTTDLIKDDANNLGDYIYINDSSAFEQDNSMRIPIVDVYFDRSIQNSEQFTSKEKQSIVLKEFLWNTFKILASEYTYFSSTTFYTVGYGDVEIKGRLPKLLAQSQMFIAGFFHVIFIPFVMTIITDNISKRRKRQD